MSLSGVPLDRGPLGDLQSYVDANPPATKVFLKLEGGKLRAVPADKLRLRDRIGLFLGKLGIGAYSLSNIFKSVLVLAKEHPCDFTAKALDKLIVQIENHNKDFWNPVKIDIRKVFEQVAKNRASKAAEILRPTPPPQVTPPRLPKDSPQSQLLQLRNLTIDFAMNKSDAKQQLEYFKRDNPFSENTPYVLQEALKLIEAQELRNSVGEAELPPINQEAITQVFALVDELDVAPDAASLALVEEKLDTLSQTQLAASLETIPKATSDALFYARGLLNDKKEALLPKEPIVVQVAPQPDERGVIRQRGDGACLFRSFATGLALNNVPLHAPDEALAEPSNVGPDRYHQLLRNEVAAYLAEHKNDDSVAAEIFVGAQDYNEKLQAQNLQDHGAFESLDQAVRAKMIERFDRQYEQKRIPEDEEIPKYLELLRTPTFWGGGLEITSLGKLYNVHVRVWEQKEGVIVLKPGVDFDPDDPENALPTVNLYYEDGDHYNAYVPPEIPRALE